MLHGQYSLNGLNEAFIIRFYAGFGKVKIGLPRDWGEPEK